MIAQCECGSRIRGFQHQPPLDTDPDNDRAVLLHEQDGTVLEIDGTRQGDGAVCALVRDGTEPVAAHVMAVEDDALDPAIMLEGMKRFADIGVGPEAHNARQFQHAERCPCTSTVGKTQLLAFDGKTADE